MPLAVARGLADSLSAPFLTPSAGTLACERPMLARVPDLARIAEGLPPYLASYAGHPRPCQALKIPLGRSA